jgi:hypothetical protein
MNMISSRRMRWTGMRDMRMYTRLQSKHLKGRDQLGNLGVERRVLIKYRVMYKVEYLLAS